RQSRCLFAAAPPAPRRRGLTGALEAEGQLADRGEAAAVEGGRAEFGERALMLGRGIALVRLPAIAGVRSGMLDHDPVARHLGDDRGGGDRAAFGVARDDRERGPL